MRLENSNISFTLRLHYGVLICSYPHLNYFTVSVLAESPHFSSVSNFIFFLFPIKTSKSMENITFPRFYDGL